MIRKTTRVLMIPMLVAAAAASPRTQASETETGTAIDAHALLSEPALLDRKDARDRLYKFGFRPTIVLVLDSIPWKKGELRSYVKYLRELDRRAGAWKGCGVETVLAVPPVYVGTGRSRVRLPLLRKARLRHINAFEISLPDAPPWVAQSVCDSFLNLRLSNELRVRYGLIERPGVLLRTGEGVDAPELEEWVRRHEGVRAQPAGTDPRIFEHLVQWRLGAALRSLAALEKRAGADASEVPASRRYLEEACTQAEQLFRKREVEPLQKRGYLIEVADALERLATRHLHGSDRAREVLLEVKALRARDDFARLESTRRRVRALGSEKDAIVDRIFETAGKKSSGYDPVAIANEQVRQLPGLIARLQAALREEHESPYAIELRYWLRDLEEELGEARSTVGRR